MGRASGVPIREAWDRGPGESSATRREASNGPRAPLAITALPSPNQAASGLEGDAVAWSGLSDTRRELSVRRIENVRSACDCPIQFPVRKSARSLWTIHNSPNGLRCCKTAIVLRTWARTVALSCAFSRSTIMPAKCSGGSAWMSAKSRSSVTRTRPSLFRLQQSGHRHRTGARREQCRRRDRHRTGLWRPRQTGFRRS